MGSALQHEADGDSSPEGAIVQEVASTWVSHTDSVKCVLPIVTTRSSPIRCHQSTGADLVPAGLVVVPNRIAGRKL